MKKNNDDDFSYKIVCLSYVLEKNEIKIKNFLHDETWGTRFDLSDFNFLQTSLSLFLVNPRLLH